MTIKQEVIAKINEWIQNELVPNKLNIVVDNDGADEINFDELKLVNLNFSRQETNKHSPRFNTYKTVVHIFDIGEGRLVQLEIDEFNLFSGIFALGNYNIYDDSDIGTELEENYDDVKWYEDYGLSDALNEYDYSEFFSEKISPKYFDSLESEIANENLLSLELAQECFPGVIEVSSVSIEETCLHFSSGVSINIRNIEIERAIRTLMSLKESKQQKL